MKELTIIRGPWPHASTGLRIEMEADRSMLLKRRWRGIARDGLEFGFDLENPLEEGAVFFATEESHYVVAQKPEPVLQIALHDPTQAARVAWSLGNLHFPVQVEAGVITVVDDSAVRLYLERDHVAFFSTISVFRPIKSVSHHHGHGHPHAH